MKLLFFLFCIFFGQVLGDSFTPSFTATGSNWNYLQYASCSNTYGYSPSYTCYESPCVATPIYVTFNAPFPSNFTESSITGLSVYIEPYSAWGEYVSVNNAYFEISNAISGSYGASNCGFLLGTGVTLGGSTNMWNLTQTSPNYFQPGVWNFTLIFQACQTTTVYFDCITVSNILFVLKIFFFF